MVPQSGKRSSDRQGADGATYLGHCPAFNPPAQRGNLTADHPEPLGLDGEPLPARPGALCSTCMARKGLSQR